VHLNYFHGIGIGIGIDALDYTASSELGSRAVRLIFY
tara:strand:+ start:17 stop:127 length:111 start_codon:yes stop_codon:yes gene_type:complete